MNKDETKKIFTLIQMTYRNHFKNISEMEIKVGLTLWHNHFANIPFEVMQEALMQYTATVDSHPPTPASINKLIHEMITINKITPEESFEKVYKLINKARFDHNNLETESLNDIEKEIVTARYIKELGKSSEGDINFFRSSYIKLYRGKEDRIKHSERINLNQIGTEKILKLMDKKKFLLEE